LTPLAITGGGLFVATMLFPLWCETRGQIAVEHAVDWPLLVVLVGLIGAAAALFAAAFL